MRYLLSLEGISKSYKTQTNHISVLSSISIDFAPGEFVVIMGPSGSGKTTLLNIIAFADRPDTGTIRLFDENGLVIEDRSYIRSKKIGQVNQSFNLISFLNALENVQLPSRLAGISNKASLISAKDLLSQVGLQNRLYHTPSELSYGEQQRVAIARSLINDPCLVIADEPTGNLDQNTSQEIISIMKDLCHSKNITFIVATHDQYISALADRLFTLENGSIQQREK